MTRLARASLPMIILALVFAAGCGSSKKKTEAPISPEKKAFIAKADAACQDVYKKTDGLVKKFRDQYPQPTPDQASKFLRDVTPVAKDSLKKIDAIKGPASDAATLDRIKAAANKGLALVEKAGHDSSLASGIMAGGDDPFAEAKGLAKNYGLKGCARA